MIFIEQVIKLVALFNKWDSLHSSKNGASISSNSPVGEKMGAVSIFRG